MIIYYTQWLLTEKGALVQRMVVEFDLQPLPFEIMLMWMCEQSEANNFLWMRFHTSQFKAGLRRRPLEVLPALWTCPWLEPPLSVALTFVCGIKKRRRGAFFWLNLNLQTGVWESRHCQGFREFWSEFCERCCLCKVALVKEQEGIKWKD